MAALLAKRCLENRDDDLATRILIYEKHMGSTTLGDANRAAMTGLAGPQNIEMDRGSHGRVRGDGRT
jgi:hypothetical protein